MSPEELHHHTLHQLDAWGGYPAIALLMHHAPSLHVYLAGGALRDILLRRSNPPKDFDLFVQGASLEDIVSFLELHGRVEYGPFGSPRWFPSSAQGKYADVIGIERFWNGVSWCRNIDDALRQFDFTANATAIDIRTGEFFDPLIALDDIQSGVMRAVRFDYPDEMISERCSLTRPAIVWFRILHYAAACRLKIEPETLAWLRRNTQYREATQAFEDVFFKLDRDAFTPINVGAFRERRLEQS
ncbi:MAG TPA: hypothetical protein VF381_04430 [Thermoanaerobaculia bacterium]